MREIKAEAVTAAVRQLCITANKVLPEDLVQCIGCARRTELNSTAKSILGDLENNLAAAKELDLPICQDTGMAVVFAEIGQDVHIDGDFEAAVHAGVSAGYTDGLLRKSVVRDPFFDRVNTGDNTPAVIHTRLVPGDRVRLTVAPKGFGSENMSALRMFTPAATRQDLVDYIVGVVQKAGSNPCPPVVIGVGIGGDLKSALCWQRRRCVAHCPVAIQTRTMRRWSRSCWRRLTHWTSGLRDLAAKPQRLV